MFSGFPIIGRVRYKYHQVSVLVSPVSINGTRRVYPCPQLFACDASRVLVPYIVVQYDVPGYSEYQVLDCI